jgi:hypothetical protein
MSDLLGQRYCGIRISILCKFHLKEIDEVDLEQVMQRYRMIDQEV